MIADWSVWFGLRIAGLATGISVGIGLLAAFYCTGREWPGALNALPARFKALLPAPVFFYCLGARTGFWPFTQPLLIAAAVLSIAPLFLSGARTAFAALDPGYAKAARTMGVSDWLFFSRVQLPMAFRPVLQSAFDAFLAISFELAFAWWLIYRLAAPGRP